ncbi:MAG TPA: diguanylate cyclase, partial [Nitrospiria bacterium]|nr:diguanylate cyclase [Nitrospiria bacterium]
MPKPRILLIEDNPLQARNTRKILEDGGYSVLVTETGGEGFKEAKLNEVDLVLLDLVLPDYSGEKICQWIKRDSGTRNLPIIMLTAKGSIEDKVAGLEVGADDYLTKPFAEAELLARIKTMLRIKRLQDELRAKNLDLERALKEVELKAITDSGTGLFNRRHFFDLLEKEFTRAKRFSDPLSCLLIDIDHFKLINDIYGHHVGDSVLKEIAEKLKEAVRLIEVAARYGGEEFVLI